MDKPTLHSHASADVFAHYDVYRVAMNVYKRDDCTVTK